MTPGLAWLRGPSLPHYWGLAWVQPQVNPLPICCSPGWPDAEDLLVAAGMRHGQGAVLSTFPGPCSLLLRPPQLSAGSPPKCGLMSCYGWPLPGVVNVSGGLGVQ